MTRWLMPTIVAVSLSGVFSAMLNAYHRFRVASMVGVVLNVVTITTVVLLNHKIGIFALVLGTTLGLIAQMAVFRFRRSCQSASTASSWTAASGPAKDLGASRPIIVASAAGQIALFFDRFFASTLSPGYMAGMNYATKLVYFPQQVFGAAIATVIFPLLAAHYARDNRRGVAGTLVTGLRLVNFITIPAMCVLIVLAHPMVETLFQRGSFQASATDLTAGLMPYAAFGLVALAANIVLTVAASRVTKRRLPSASP